MNSFNQITDIDGEKFVKEARKIITEIIVNKKKIELDEEFKARFGFKSGVFVTINKLKNLRGCIGFPLPQKKFFDALVEASISAATADPRFPKVTPEELDEITFEVTVLSPPVEVKVSNPLEYPSKIKVGTDGLLVKFEFNSGLLLPQVPVEYGWNEEEFLGYTCEKAGLPRDIWKDQKTKVLKFEGIVYEEKTPNGKIIRKNYDSKT